jgi:hypothetical protein
MRYRGPYRILTPCIQGVMHQSGLMRVDAVSRALPHVSPAFDAASKSHDGQTWCGPYLVMADIVLAGSNAHQMGAWSSTVGGGGPVDPGLYSPFQGSEPASDPRPYFQGSDPRLYFPGSEPQAAPPTYQTVVGSR